MLGFWTMPTFSYRLFIIFSLYFSRITKRLSNVSKMFQIDGMVQVRFTLFSQAARQFQFLQSRVAKKWTWGSWDPLGSFFRLNQALLAECPGNWNKNSSTYEKVLLWLSGFLNHAHILLALVQYILSVFQPYYKTPLKCFENVSTRRHGSGWIHTFLQSRSITLFSESCS